jgi:hypothetical protein
MNAYTYDQILVGQEETFTVTVTDDDMKAFRKITHDNNPLHCDDGYAKLRGYDGRVVYGMLTASYLSTLAGMYLPGKRSLIYEVETKFSSSLILRGSTNLFIHGKVAEKNDMFRRIVIKVRVTDGDGNKILRGTMKVGVADE